jgi:hypothetical protein
MTCAEASHSKCFAFFHLDGYGLESPIKAQASLWRGLALELWTGDGL